MAKKWLNFLITLGLWTLLNHRNGCVFDRIKPSLEVAIKRIEDIANSIEEVFVWGWAGASGLCLW